MEGHGRSGRVSKGQQRSQFQYVTHRQTDRQTDRQGSGIELLRAAKKYRFPDGVWKGGEGVWPWTPKV